MLGSLVFRQRVRGAYFAILTQALAAAFVILLVGQQGLTGGTNGLTNFYDLFGQDLAADSTQRGLYFAVADRCWAALPRRPAAGEQPLRAAARRGQGRRGPGPVPRLRPGEGQDRHLRRSRRAWPGSRARCSCPASGIISPALLGVVPSLELVVAVAVGGRFALAGAVLGAVVMGYAKTSFSEQFADGWLYLQGALFILVMTLAPKGDPRPGGVGPRRPGAAADAPGAAIPTPARGRPRQESHGGGRVSAMIEVRGLSVVFDGFRAIDGIDLTVEQGELRFLIGPNGAGKTTLIDVITGLTRPTTGAVVFDGRSLVGLREHQIVRLGVGRTFQTSVVFEELTVLENLDLAAVVPAPLWSLAPARRGVSDAVAEALEIIGLDALADQPAGVLSHGQRQWLEIGMLLAQEPELLLLDEPVAGMSKDERERTGELMTSVARDHTVIVIEHDMEFLRRYASQVTVLHEGRVLIEGSVDQIRADPRVQEVYLGRKPRSDAVGRAILTPDTAGPGCCSGSPWRWSPRSWSA